MAEFKPQPVKGPDVPPVSEPQPQEPEFFGTPITRPSFWQRIKEFLSNNKWYVVAIAVGVAIIGALATFAFWPQQSERQEAAKVQLSIEAPESVSAGGEVIYKIKVLNQDSAKLVNMNLELVYADGISYVASTPKAGNISGSSFAVPDLTSGQNAVVIVKTLAQGNVNDTKKIVARLQYRFENFNSPFNIESSHEVRLTAADVVVDLSGPGQANNSEVVSYDILYRNSSKKDIENSRIQVTYPNGFEFAESNPRPSLGQNIWNIGTLKANDTGKIGFKGAFKNAGSGQSYSFKVEFLVLDNEGNFYTQSSTSYTTEISSQPIMVEQKISNISKDGIAKPGDTVNVELTFRNNEQVVNTGVQVVAQLDSDSIDYSSIRSEAGFVQDGTITWNGSGVSSLEKLNPGDSGSVKYLFKIKDPASTSGKTNIEIKLRAKIKSNENSTFISGTDQIIKISSPADLQASVSHSGGPLPLKVGQSSSFTVSFKLGNRSNDYRDGVFIGYIPNSASLDISSITAQEKSLVKYDSSTGKLQWNFGRLAANAGTQGSSRTLQFKVSVTPSVSMVGQEPPLFKTISVTATDDFTGQAIELKNRDVDTGDIAGDGDTRVQQ